MSNYVIGEISEGITPVAVFVEEEAASNEQIGQLIREFSDCDCKTIAGPWGDHSELESFFSGDALIEAIRGHELPQTQTLVFHVPSPERVSQLTAKIKADYNTNGTLKAPHERLEFI